MTTTVISTGRASCQRMSQSVHLLLASIVAVGLGLMTTRPVLAQASYVIEDLGVLSGDTSSVATVVSSVTQSA